MEANGDIYLGNLASGIRSPGAILTRAETAGWGKMACGANRLVARRMGGGRKLIISGCRPN